MRNINKLLKYLLEQHIPSGKYVLFIDLDGVLADFDSALTINQEFLDLDAELSELVKNKFGKEINREDLKSIVDGYQKDPEIRRIKNMLYDVNTQIYKTAGKENFFADLDVMPGAKRMFDIACSMVSTEPFILSAPMRSEFCESEKRVWVAKHFGIPDSNVIIDSEKYKYTAPNHILIDDRKNNISKWIAAGGIGVIHTSPDDTIKQLEEIINDHDVTDMI
jgi:5'(3')-deoxyribonucleotidase